jgi:hypothetical protein
MIKSTYNETDCDRLTKIMGKVQRLRIIDGNRDVVSVLLQISPLLTN